jgi:hypothetical protein
LTSIALYRVLTARQIADLHGRNLEVVRRRFRLLEAGGLIHLVKSPFGGANCRPERLASLRPAAIDALKTEGILRPDAPPDQILAEDIGFLEHHLLTNEFCLQMAAIPRVCPSIHVRFCSRTSALLNRSVPGAASIEEQFETEDGQEIRFIPDGVFALTHKPTGRTLHFYLEVDMGTETLASPWRSPQDVRAKILNYQACFGDSHYKRYEQMWRCSLRGFRLLILACTGPRANDICHLVKEMPPSDFVWTTDRVEIENKGVWAPIWSPGGRLNVPRGSILGSLLPNPWPSPSDLARRVPAIEPPQSPSAA